MGLPLYEAGTAAELSLAAKLVNGVYDVKSVVKNRMTIE
jgi:hypothetical protein